MRYLLICLLCACSSAAAYAETLIYDQWYIGTFNNQPAINAHLTVTEASSGALTTAFEMNMIIGRQLGNLQSDIEIKQYREYHESSAGITTGFEFSDEQNGNRMLATGRIDHENALISATVHRSTSSKKQELPIPEGVRIIGQRESQKRIAENLRKKGDKDTFHVVEFIMGQLYILKTDVELLRITDEGNLVCSSANDLMPTAQSTMEITPTGDLVNMSMQMGPIAIALLPADGPTPIKAARLDISGVVQAKGPAPSAIGPNRYRISDKALPFIVNDEFQQRAGNILTVQDEGEPLQLEDDKAFLAAEPQLELDDPEFREWVHKQLATLPQDTAISARIEQLRVATRGHINRPGFADADASALETFRQRSGDCTEYSNMLCAALRIAGIPARTEAGFVFAPDYGSWVGHAWVSAYNGTAWELTDAAYPGINRSSYISCGITSGRTGQAVGHPLATFTSLFGETIEVLSE